MGWNLEGRCFFGIGAWFILLLPQSNFCLFWKWFLHRRGSIVPANLLLWRDRALGLCSTSRCFGIVLWFGSLCSVCAWVLLLCISSDRLCDRVWLKRSWSTMEAGCTQKVLIFFVWFYRFYVAWLILCRLRSVAFSVAWKYCFFSRCCGILGTLLGLNVEEGSKK